MRRRTALALCIVILVVISSISSCTPKQKGMSIDHKDLDGGLYPLPSLLGYNDLHFRKFDIGWTTIYYNKEVLKQLGLTRKNWITGEHSPEVTITWEHAPALDAEVRFWKNSKRKLEEITINLSVPPWPNEVNPQEGSIELSKIVLRGCLREHGLDEAAQNTFLAGWEAGLRENLERGDQEGISAAAWKLIIILGWDTNLEGLVGSVRPGGGNRTDFSTYQPPVEMLNCGETTATRRGHPTFPYNWRWVDLTGGTIEEGYRISISRGNSIPAENIRGIEVIEPDIYYVWTQIGKALYQQLFYRETYEEAHHVTQRFCSSGVWNFDSDRQATPTSVLLGPGAKVRLLTADPELFVIVSN